MIYAPIIDTRLQVGYNGSVNIRFRMNPAVSFNDINGMTLVVLDSTGFEKVAEATTNNMDTSIKEDNFYVAKFSIGSLTEGTFYRIKIGYSSDNITYSSLGTLKYTGEPILTAELTNDNSSINLTYTNSDSTEKLIYYSIIDNNYPNEVISGVYDNTTLNPEVGMTIELNHYPSAGLKIKGTTISGIEISFDINGEDISKPTVTVTMPAVNEYYLEAEKYPKPNELGYIKFVKKNIEDGADKGKLEGEETPGRILRSSENNSDIYDILGESINFDSSFTSGVQYNYLIEDRQYTFTPFLENIILSDANHILPIKFNPKVSSYKKVIQESKQETMGSKYPYIFRNNVINYTEIPLSGLLSYLEDEVESFVTWKNKESIDLTGENIALEKEFKNKVYEWLTNGEPKLLRTPTEGSFVVRLMNVSLSPNDTLGRMLHTFNCTAYEIAEYSTANIKKYNLNWGLNYDPV